MEHSCYLKITSWLSSSRGQEALLERQKGLLLQFLVSFTLLWIYLHSFLFLIYIIDLNKYHEDENTRLLNLRLIEFVCLFLYYTLL